jgi:hypothetical protein
MMNSLDEVPLLRAPALPFVVVGRCGEVQLESGWHEREQDGRNGIPYRATSPDAFLSLRAIPGATRLHLLVSGPVGIAQRPIDARIIFNRKKFELPIFIDHWAHRHYPLEVTKGTVQVRFKVAEPVIPDLMIGNGDPRRLGIYLSAIWME